MDLELDRKILLTKQIEHKSLYGWCLQELDKNGNKIGRDQIPYDFGIAFDAVNLSYAIYFRGESKNNLRLKESESPFLNFDKKIKPPLKHSISEEEIISANLTSDIAIKMFCKDVAIKEIYLRIEKGDTENCYCDGRLGRTYESAVDFTDEEYPDLLEFTVVLKTEKFNKIAELIKSNSIDKLHFMPDRINGFYSEWSPSISTRNIKVLCDESEHKFEVDKKSKLTPLEQKKIPLLHVGDVFDFRLSVVYKTNKDLTSPKNDDDDYSELIEKPLNLEHNNFDKNLVVQFQKLVQAFAASILIILILLVLILVFK